MPDRPSLMSIAVTEPARTASRWTEWRTSGRWAVLVTDGRGFFLDRYRLVEDHDTGDEQPADEPPFPGRY